MPWLLICHGPDPRNGSRGTAEGIDGGVRCYLTEKLKCRRSSGAILREISSSQTRALKSGQHIHQSRWGSCADPVRAKHYSFARGDDRGGATFGRPYSSSG